MAKHRRHGNGDDCSNGHRQCTGPAGGDCGFGCIANNSGRGGNATASTTVTSGAGEANASSTANGGAGGGDSNGVRGGAGGSATSTATATGGAGDAKAPSIDHYEAKAFGHAEAPFGPARTRAMARERPVPLGLRWRQPRGSGRVSLCLQRPALPLFQISASSR